MKCGADQDAEALDSSTASDLTIPNNETVPNATRAAVLSRRVLLNALSNYACTFIRLSMGFLLTPFILHHIGSTAFGLLTLVMSTIGYSSLLEFGIAGAITKYVAGCHARGQMHEAQSLITTALCLYSLLGLLTFGLSLAIAPIVTNLFNVPPDMQSTALWLVVLLGFQIAISIPSAAPAAILFGLQRYDLVNLTVMIETLITALATVLVLTHGGSVLALVAVSIPLILLTQAARILIIRRIAPDLRLGPVRMRRQMVRTIMSFSASVFLTNMAWRIETKSDNLVIGATLPIAAITPYTIAQRLSEIARMLTEQFVKVLLPLASELDARNNKIHLRELYIASTRLTLAIFLPIGCVIVILARSILTAWVGGAYAEYANLVTILTAAGLIDISQWPAGSILQGMGRHRPLAAIVVCSALANVALSIMLVRKFGLTGIAVGTLIPMTVAYLGFMLPYALRVIGVSFTDVLKNVLLPSLLPAVPTAIVLYVLQEATKSPSLLSIMVVASIGFVVYAAGYLTMGASKLERQACRSLALSTVRFVEARFKQV